MRYLMWLRAGLTIVSIALAGSAFAEPIVITDGHLGYDTGDPASFVFIGDGFTVRALFQRLATAVPCAVPCEAGAQVNFSARFGTASSSFDLGQGIVTIGTNTYGTSFGPGAVVLRGQLAFDVPATHIPHENVPLRIRLAEQFTFTGQIVGFGDPATTETLFAVDLVGTGEALLALDQSHRFEGVSYAFSIAPVAPTPEPGTVLLVGSAIIGLVTRRGAWMGLR